MYKDFLLKFSVFLLLVAASFSSSYAQVTVTAPDDVAGQYFSVPAAFSPIIAAPISGPLVIAQDTSTTDATACDVVTNDLTGAIALVDRGVCGFTIKVKNAQDAGAIAVIICNNNAFPDSVIIAGGADPTITVPTVMLSYNDCQKIRTAIPGVTVTIDVPQNSYCAYPTPISGEGTYTTDTIVGTGALLTGATAARYFSFTAPADTLVTIDACNSGVDTRLAILAGCSALITANDDCDADNEIYGSSVSFLAQAGVTYTISWDNPWSSSGFEWTLSYGALPSVNITLQVDMSQVETVADTVLLLYGQFGAATLADIQYAGMTDEDGDGIYATTIEVTALDTIIYVFSNGLLSPASVETVPAACGLDNGLGFSVRGIIASTTQDAVVSPVCFSGCTECLISIDDCDNPLVLIDDDFESYTVNEAPTGAWWTTWEGAAQAGRVSSDQAVDALSYRITGNGSDVDVVLNLGDKTQGHYILSWKIFVPANRNAYYNIQHFEAVGTEWAYEVYFTNGGTGRVSAGTATAATFTFTQDAWVDVVQFIDIDNDIVRLYIDDKFVYSWPFHWQASAQSGTKQLGAVNFYPSSTAYLFFIDDVYYAQIPAAAEGYYCYTAVEAQVGVNNVPDVKCFGAGLRNETRGVSAYGGYWFTYTPTEDGIISIGSCDNGGVDTRGWILSGDCYNFATHGVNDDQCDNGAGDNYASYREAIVKAGTTYYIMWDNVWDENGFDWELTFSTDDPVPGNFCASAIAIEPGIHTVAGIDGHAAVSGPVIGSVGQTSTPTPYMQSEWYSFTPTEDGEIVVTSCEFNNDTRLYVYDGSCESFETLRLLASNDDCDSDLNLYGSQVRVAVTAGTTYFIEWDDRWYNGEFDFELRFGAPAVNVTFKVDASVLAANGELAAEGLFIAGEFTNFVNAAMTNEGNNIWSYTTALAQGDTVQYKFKNGPDGWETVDVSLGGDCTLGGFGDRFVVPGSEDITLDPVCFGYCVSCQTVGTEDVAFNAALNIFPNPAKEATNIKYNFEQATDLVIRMTNSLGQVIAERKINNARSGIEEINVSELAAGMYFLYITDGERAKTETLVIQK